ncbi:type I-F CRISPR-associated helicase Cas3f [Aquisalimonas asiatica]|uniref:CRISPR-associated endonuclease/helicase Cas3 n=1 Tax=Aquisalimonas asiatica TaxID=406100 RepID=A0A1H8TBM4_9GAMM|nr:type I-F CRISPR-associated helicase Cas3f [Aquisalimonas asiatica]SEO87883.1 CRISPR-associated endonuclease/helicase Cas3 [Aquisalimonas asiatica]
MNVLLVSQCNKNALTETRRILDQFAERRGDRTWQTPITEAGLDTLRRMLRKTARKNTAVACHWIRGRDHSELLWIVGDAKRFNQQGAIPTNTSSRDVLRRGDENDWRTGEDIRLLSGLTALFHDLGKSMEAFQLRLQGKLEGRNLYRHEWVSLRLFLSFVGDSDDATWLNRLASGAGGDTANWLNGLQRDGVDAGVRPPFSDLPPLASAVAWLILTHHRLPLMPGDGQTRPAFQAERLRDLPGIISADWNEVADSRNREQAPLYWRFKEGLPVATDGWQARVRYFAQRLLDRLPYRESGWLDDPYVMHLSRLSVMLADHHYSSLDDRRHRVRGNAGYPLFANTVRNTGQLNQPLDEHLLGVERHATAVVRALPSLHSHLPRLARHKGFRKRSDHRRFRWQDRAYDMAQSLRERSEEQGFFGINMASTGCGKTLANGRILYALANPQRGARFVIALGLRTLTLQTGKAYRERLNLGEDELAVRVGGGASRALFEHYEEEADKSGSESRQNLIEDDTHVVFDGNMESHPVLRRLGDDPRARALIAAPILLCTVDHLMPATESTRGGDQIVPMLRMMSSDLVLDEIDDFDINDLPALTRLVHWAGLLGSRVLLSSATLPPALVRGLYDAYRDGREQYQRNRGQPGLPVDICCAWFDEHDRQHENCPAGEQFAAAHHRFAKRRHQRLAEGVVRRRAEVASMEGLGKTAAETRQGLAERVLAHASTLHARHHSVDPHTHKRVSFGLVRMANIEPLIDVARALFQLGAPAGIRIHLCVYHSRYPLLIRSAIEQRLDRALDRRDESAVFDLPEVQSALQTTHEADQVFIVLGSPVTEVGRDHDYDWAVVEPSSMRSIIQLAGRVRRHRDDACTAPNVVLLDTNLKHLENPGRPAFQRPGFETTGDWMLNSHSLTHLLETDQWQAIDARPRIVERENLQPLDSIVDLEHARLRCALVAPPPKTLSKREQRAMQTPPPPRLGAYTWYAMPQVQLTGVMQQCQPFRQQTAPEVELALLPDEGGETWTLHQIHDGSRRGELLYVPVEQSKLQRIDVLNTLGERIQPWGEEDYMDALAVLADTMDLPLDDAAKRFGTATVPDNDSGWGFHPILGFCARH